MEETKDLQPATSSHEIEENEEKLKAIAAVQAHKQADLDQHLRELHRTLWELQQSNPMNRPPGSPPSVYPQLEHSMGQSVGGGRALG